MNRRGRRAGRNGAGGDVQGGMAKLVKVRSPHEELLPRPSETLFGEAEEECEGGLELRGEGMVSAPIPSHVVEWVKQLLEECHVAPEQPKWNLVRKRCKEIHLNNRGHVVGMLREHIKRENYENATRLIKEDKQKLDHALARYQKGRSLTKLAAELGVGRATLGKLLAEIRLGKHGKSLLKSAAKFLHSNDTSWRTAHIQELHRDEVQFLLRLAKHCEGDCVTPLLDSHAQEAGAASEAELANRIRDNLAAVSLTREPQLGMAPTTTGNVPATSPTEDPAALRTNAGSLPEMECVGTLYSQGTLWEEQPIDRRMDQNATAELSQEGLAHASTIRDPKRDPFKSIESSPAANGAWRVLGLASDNTVSSDAEGGEESEGQKDALFAENVRDEAALRHPLQTNVTPDLLLTRPCTYDGVQIRWVESKSGLVIPGLSLEQTVENLQKQLQNYCKYLGPGVVFWKKGYTEAVEELVPGVLHRTGIAGAFNDTQASLNRTQCKSPLANFSFDRERIMSYMLCK